MKILIVEDEPIAADFINQMIKDHFEDCEIVGIARSVTEAVKFCKDLSPDLLIMDINLGDHFSFDLFESMDAGKLNVVFVSGYHEFALKAIKAQAIDYLLKPVNYADLKSALDKVRVRLQSNSMNIVEEKGNEMNEILLVWENDRLKPVEIINIIKIKSDRNYSTIYLHEGKEILTSKNLGLYEELLGGKGFFRIHKSCLINALHFKSYQPGINAKIQLSDDYYESISRRKKDELAKLLDRKK